MDNAKAQELVRKRRELAKLDGELEKVGDAFESAASREEKNKKEDKYNSLLTKRLALVRTIQKLERS